HSQLLEPSGIWRGRGREGIVNRIVAGIRPASPETSEPNGLAVSEPELHTTQLHRLVERIQAGDALAQNELVRLTGGRLEPPARSMLRRFPGVRRWEETGDLLQNALLRLLKSLETVRPAC